MAAANPNRQEYLKLLDILSESECVKKKIIKHVDRTCYFLRYSPFPKRFNELSDIHGALLASRGKFRFGGLDYKLKCSKINDCVEFTGVIFTTDLYHQKTQNSG